MPLGASVSTLHQVHARVLYIIVFMRARTFFSPPDDVYFQLFQFYFKCFSWICLNNFAVSTTNNTKNSNDLFLSVQDQNSYEY